MRPEELHHNNLVVCKVDMIAQRELHFGPDSSTFDSCQDDGLNLNCKGTVELLIIVILGPGPLCRDDQVWI